MDENMMTMEVAGVKAIRNLTPHPVHVRTAEGGSFTFLPDDRPARVETSSRPTGMLRMPESCGSARFVVETERGSRSVTDLPPEERGVYYIVSRLVALVAGGRNDLLVPGAAIRDQSGRIVGAEGFIRVR